MTDKTPLDPARATAIRENFARQGLMTHLGATLETLETGLCTISMPFKPELTQQRGFFHAGGLSSIADSAGGYAGLTMHPTGDDVLTVEFKLNLLNPAQGARLLTEGHVIKAGRTLTICRLEVFAETEGSRTHCATGQQTLIRVPAA